MGADDTTEADVTCRCIDGMRMAGRWSIATTIIQGAQMRAALQYATRRFQTRGVRFVAFLLAATTGIFRYAARFVPRSTMTWAIPVLRPFPCIADHVEQAEGIGRKATDGRGTFILVDQQVLIRKPALPEVRQRLPVRHELIA